MKVLQINSVCGYGSTGRIAVDIYNTLIDNGHDCVIAYGRGKAPDGIKSIKIGNVLDLCWKVFLTRIFDNHSSGSKHATKKLIKQIDAYNPDIIHLHNVHGYYINLKILFNYLKKINKPIVWTLHDCWTFTGHCSYFDYIKCEKWKKECNACKQKNSYPNSMFLDSSTQNYHLKKELFNGLENLTIVTPSEWLAKLVKESFLKRYNVETINNGIDLNIFKPTESNLRKKYNLEEKFIVLGVASKWEHRKGLKELIKLSNKLNDNYKIILIGITKKDKKSLPGNILAIERTNNINQLVEFYSMANVFVNPTLEDNFPTTNLEALACGTPVITYNTGGSIECINSNNGYIVDSNSVEELIEKIENVKDKQFDTLKNIDIYSKEYNYKKYIELYKKINREE